MPSISSLSFCSSCFLNAACQNTPSLHSPLLSRRLQGLSDDHGIHISGPFLFLGPKTSTQRSLGQFLPDILQMLTIQRVQIRPSSPVDMCCLHEERYQQVCSVQESLSGSASTRPHAQSLLLCLGILFSILCGAVPVEKKLSVY